jgi:hypothetical protein
MPSFVETLATGFAILFPFWPFLLLGALSRRKRILRNMLFVWGILAAMRGVVFFAPVQLLPITLIPDPLNTILFFATGVALTAVPCGQRLWARASFLRKAKQANTISDLLELSPREFEDLIAETYRAFGHQAKRTGSIGDHGVDVIIKTKGGEKHVVQCKRWRKNVGEPIIRDFYGVVQHEKADKGIVITTAGFTPQAQEWARGKPLSLINGNQLLKALKQGREKRNKVAEN